MSPRQRATRLGLGGLLALTLAACSSVDHSDPNGVKTGNITYYDNGTRAYEVHLPSSSDKKMQVYERCQDTTTLETTYIDDGGALKAVTAQDEPIKCADGKLTLEDFTQPVATPSPVK